MKKRVFLNVLAVILLVMAMAPGAFAAEERHIADGECGENLKWSLDGYTLTISGSGEMIDGCPWIEHMDHIEHVVLKDGVTTVGKEAFYKFDRLETIDFGDSLVEIGKRAFYGCEDLDYIHLPSTFRTFGVEAFRGCTNLKYVYCDGGMPRFNDSCLWTGEYISVFYRGDNVWPADAVQTLVHNFGGRLGIMMGSFENSDLVKNFENQQEETEETGEETTEATTEATEETVPETTEAAVIVIATEPETQPTTQPTEATTEATTQPTETTEAVTEETTVAPTTEPETTFDLDLEETEEAEPVELPESKSWIGLALIAGVLFFILLGAIIFKLSSRRGGRYRRRR